MGLLYKFKQRLFNTFRELFVYHHSSLEFRAKVFALLIAANAKAGECEYELVSKAGMKIYNDTNRTHTLLLTTQEYVQKVWDDNGLDIDTLVHKIVEDLKLIPRYTQKIDIEDLEPLIHCHEDEDTRQYQHRMLEFLAQAKKDYSR